MSNNLSSNYKPCEENNNVVRSDIEIWHRSHLPNVPVTTYPIIMSLDLRDNAQPTTFFNNSEIFCSEMYHSMGQMNLPGFVNRNWTGETPSPSNCSDGSEDLHLQTPPSTSTTPDYVSPNFYDQHIQMHQIELEKEQLQLFNSMVSDNPHLSAVQNQIITEQKLLVQKLKRQGKKFKILQNQFEAQAVNIDRQQQLSEDLPSQVTSRSTPPSTNIPSPVYDALNGINAIASTSRDTGSPSDTSIISVNIPVKKAKLSKEPVRLTEEVYQTEPGYMIPRCDAKGNIKYVLCKKKHCNQSFQTKHELWYHTRSHLEGKKIFDCPEPYCNFVTGHQHHLEYHRNLHTGERSYKCKDCDYAAPNKATLASHEKSHVDFYHYSCGDCSVRVKYEHTFKQHLRKYGHKPGEIRDSTGEVIPNKVIDVMGSKRGPKTKTATTDRSSIQNRRSSLVENGASFYPSPPHHETQAPQNYGPMAPQGEISFDQDPIPQDLSMRSAYQPYSDVPLDLSTSLSRKSFSEEAAEVQPIKYADKKPIEKRTGTSKRKGKAIKLTHQHKQYEMSDDEEEDHNNNGFTPTLPESNPTAMSTSDYRREILTCESCDVIFGQLIMYSDHMRYHDHQDPDVCGICKKRFSNKADFYLHIGREDHSQYPQ